MWTAEKEQIKKKLFGIKTKRKANIRKKRAHQRRQSTNQQLNTANKQKKNIFEIYNRIIIEKQANIMEKRIDLEKRGREPSQVSYILHT